MALGESLNLSEPYRSMVMPPLMKLVHTCRAHTEMPHHPAYCRGRGRMNGSPEVHRPQRGRWWTHELQAETPSYSETG